VENYGTAFMSHRKNGYLENKSGFVIFAREDFLFEIKKRFCQPLSGEETITEYTE